MHATTVRRLYLAMYGGSGWGQRLPPRAHAELMPHVLLLDWEKWPRALALVLHGVGRRVPLEALLRERSAQVHRHSLLLGVRVQSGGGGSGSRRHITISARPGDDVAVRFPGLDGGGEPRPILNVVVKAVSHGANHQLASATPCIGVMAHLRAVNVKRVVPELWVVAARMGGLPDV